MKSQAKIPNQLRQILIPAQITDRNTVALVLRLVRYGIYGFRQIDSRNALENLRGGGEG